MKIRVVVIGAAILFASCSSQSHRTADAVTTPSALATPQSGASEAARAAGAESRKVIIPKIRDVPVSGVESAAIARPTALVTPVIIPKLRDVPASGVTSATSAAHGNGSLPKGVPYASDTDPIRIISCILSSTTVHPGDKITGDVVTSSNAASVTARVGAFAVEVPKVAPGKFHLLLQLPSMPLPPGDTKLIVTAVRTDGKSTRREVAVTVVL
jgi:hypothetical protein